MPFVKVANVADVPPGAAHTVILQGRELALFHVEGEFYCIDNYCPHNGGPLADGYVNGDVVMCPWHAWEFNVRTGQLVHSPRVCVTTYPCRVEAGEVLVDI